ncbi:MAG: hypothetical protein AAF633_09965 [Chloroflexota bacterium]
MEFVIRFVTESPESIAYNFVLILCLQVSFGLALWLWQKSPREDVARRMTIASGVIFLIRIGWFVVLNLYAEDRLLIAPVERALNFVAIVFLVWALAPTVDEFKSLRVIGLFIVVIGTIASLPFAIQNWTVLKATGLNFGQTNQAPVWALLQGVYCLACLSSLLIYRPYDWPLRILTVFPILGASLLHLFNVTPLDIGVSNLSFGPDNDIVGGIVPIWDRLALLISLPIFTAVVYRRNSSYMLRRTTMIAGSPEHLNRFVTRLDQLLATSYKEDKIKFMAGLINELFDPQFVGIATLEEVGKPYADVHIFQKNDSRLAFEESRVWMMNTNDWPAIVDAVNRGQTVQLTPSSQASRQLYEMHQEFHLRLVTPIMVVPLIANASYEGLLFVGAPPQQTVWPAQSIELMTPISQLLAQSLMVNRKLQIATVASDASGDLSIIDELAFDAKIDELTEQKTKVESRLFQMASRLTETERALKLAEQQLHDVRKADNGTAQKIQAELNTLKSSIQELGTGPIAPVNGSEAADGMDTEWVAQAISQYSNALEESQLQINQLENRLRAFQRGRFSDSISRLGTDARSPLTSIQAYTDLLLQDTTGFLTVKQIDLLQRVKTSAIQVNAYLESLEESFTLDELASITGSVSDFSPILDLTIDAFVDEFNRKRIEIELDICDDLPPLLVDRGTLHQIIVELIRNGLHFIPENGTFRLAARKEAVVLPGDDRKVHLVQLMLQDIPLAMHEQNQIMENLTASRPQLDTLSVEEVNIGHLYHLVKNIGGRVWFNGSESEGCTLVLLMPVAESPQEEFHGAS